jgi:hypothetical protein
VSFYYFLQILTSTTKKVPFLLLFGKKIDKKIAGHDFAGDLPEDVATKNYTKVAKKGSTKYKIKLVGPA